MESSHFRSKLRRVLGMVMVAVPSRAQSVATHLNLTKCTSCLSQKIWERLSRCRRWSLPAKALSRAKTEVDWCRDTKTKVHYCKYLSVIHSTIRVDLNTALIEIKPSSRVEATSPWCKSTVSNNTNRPTSTNLLHVTTTHSAYNNLWLRNKILKLSNSKSHYRLWPEVDRCSTSLFYKMHKTTQ